MTSSSGPDFQNPPVTEVVCGIQYGGADDWKTPHYGLYWDKIRATYPDCEEHPPLPRLRLEPPRASEAVLLPALPPLRRVFFIKPPGNFLIQLQPQRFLYNWRKISDSDKYPRFDAPYTGFAQEWERFVSFTDTAKLDQPRPEIFELTYINHIFAPGVSFPRDVWKYLGFYGATPQATTAREATGLALQIMWPLRDNLGTLSLDAKHGFRRDDGEEVLLIELSARGAAIADMKQWFSVAHIAIVTTFDALTTEDAHKLWGEKVTSAPTLEFMKPATELVEMYRSAGTASITSVHYSRLLAAIRALHFEPDEEDRPTDFATENAFKLLSAAAGNLTLEFPAAYVTVGPSRSLRISWVDGGREVRLVCGGSPNNRTYLYFEQGKSHGVAARVSGDEIASSLRWMTAS